MDSFSWLKVTELYSAKSIQLTLYLSYMRKLILSYLRRFPLDHGKHILAKTIDLSKEGNEVIYTNKYGVTFHLDLEEYQMRQIFLYDLYERNSVRHLLRLLKKHFTESSGEPSTAWPCTYDNIAGC